MTERELELERERDEARKDLEAKSIELETMRSKFEEETKMIAAFRAIEKELKYWRAEPYARSWPEPRELLLRIDNLVLEARRERE